MKTALRIAIRHLGFKHQGSFTSFAGIAAVIGLGLGICALVLTVSVLNGFEDTISRKIAGLDGHIRTQHFLFRPVDPYQSKLDSILTNQSVSYSSVPYIQEAAMVRKGRRAEGILIEGYGDDELPNDIAKMVQSGSSELENGKAVIGKALAQMLHVDVGDKLVLMDMKSMITISSGRRMKQVSIGGIYKSGLQEYDQSVVYLSLKDAQNLFHYENKISGYTISLKDGNNADIISTVLEESLGYPYYVITWKEKHNNLFNWLNLQKWPILIIFGMIALVGIVNIISALFMIVLEKIRTIGTLKSMGMDNKTIRQIFLIKGVFIGSLGSLFGLALALIFAAIQIHYTPLSISEEIYFMRYVPVLLDWSIIGMIVFCGIFFSILSALWPTGRAAAIDPADALRYE
ncbi:MAG: ABC transporter permease [Fidelibacterota bacterium]